MAKLMSFVLLGSVLAVSAATAQEPKPSPLGPPPSFVRVAAVDKTSVTLEVTVAIPEQRTGTREVEVNGKKETQVFMYTVMTFKEMARTVLAADVRLTTIGGKELALSEAVGKVVLQVATADGVNAAYKPLFAEGTLVLTPAKKK